MILDWVYKTFGRYHPAFIKGFISTCIAFLVFQQTWWGSDEALKYVSSDVLFWVNWIVGSLAFIANSLRDTISAYFADKEKNTPKAPTTS